jgi:hypothetical protein
MQNKSMVFRLILLLLLNVFPVTKFDNKNTKGMNKAVSLFKDAISSVPTLIEEGQLFTAMFILDRKVFLIKRL